MSDGFLSRWSRRKREVLSEERPAPAPVASETADPPPTAGVEVAQDPACDGEITPEELAQLPSLDHLTAETDITAFLRRGVPRALRDAALKRAWALDPKIRDFVCEAREYAYDWNVPGGVPGNGDILPTDDVAGMVRGIFGDPPPEEVATAHLPPAIPSTDEPDLRDVVSQSEEDEEACEGADSSLPHASGDAALQEDGPSPGLANASAPAATERESLDLDRTGLPGGPAAPQARWAETEPPASVPRRHGRATPI